MITFIIMNWQRTENTKRLTSALKNQSVDTKVFVFNNNAEVNYQDENADLILNSSDNLRCGACWLLMLYVFDGIICKIDDDLIPKTDKFAEGIIKTLENLEKVHGCSNVALGMESEFWSSDGGNRTYKGDGEVDCIKGKLMVFRRGLLNDFSLFEMMNLENEQYHHGELSFSAFLKEKGKNLYNDSHIRSMLSEVNSRHRAASREGNHNENRKALRKKLYSKVRS